ncbi:ATP-binding cassette domain-containing protein [Nocardia yamanashiensis]|uniref:ATP-binding cassette domain-containing protein n=1 Tax=Nocardia yamanashiensis TaxID=209247 RepID=UPI001E376727|nr:ATP-binding cassette domain-containing protein [Nocardia yamanashiensis]UGT40682.1 ATP-binding cassette domain-containing protein [Nocardia yamanashiensis]
MNPGYGPAISVEGLNKSYGEHIVLESLDFEVAEGSIYALLGPNGAGKTTTVQILSTLTKPDGGEISVGGYDPVRQADEVRSVIGVTGQFSAVDELLTGRENLLLMGDLHHLPRGESRRIAEDLLEKFDLVEAGNKVASGYSGGMTRRLDLAMTLVGSPRIIFLDEPTVGLDPRSRRAMWDIIRELVAGGVTIFLTTQYLEEADQLADRIAVLHGGRIVAEGTADQLKRMVPGGYIKLDFAEQRVLAAAALVFGAAAQVNGDLTLAIPSDGGVRSVREVLDRLDAAQLEPEGLSVHTPDLDDVFLALTGTPDKETSR